MQTDPFNCGACGHDCEGGACVDGKCQPVLLANTSQATLLAQDATHVYWVDNKMTCDVMKVPKTGGPSVVLAPGMGGGCGWNEQGIVVDDSRVYLARPGASEIAKVPIGGGALTTMVHTDNATSLARNATHLYWLGWSLGSGYLWRMPLTGGAAQLLYTSPDQALSAIAIDDTHVYTKVQNLETFVRVPLAGGASEIIATGWTVASPLAVDGSNIYWAQGEGMVEVHRAPKGGSGPPTLMATVPGAFPSPKQIMVDATSLYVTSGNNVWIIPLNGDPPMGVAPGATQAASVIADDNRIYWAAWNGNLYKVVR